MRHTCLTVRPPLLQACDWGSHPAEYILSETSTGKYLVMRQGLGFTEYGLVGGLGWGGGWALEAGMCWTGSRAAQVPSARCWLTHARPTPPCRWTRRPPRRSAWELPPARLPAPCLWPWWRSTRPSRRTSGGRFTITWVGGGRRGRGWLPACLSALVQGWPGCHADDRSYAAATRPACRRRRAGAGRPAARLGA